MTKVDNEVVRPARCRSGCPTQDHKSYAECSRGLQLNAGALLTAEQKSWDSELSAYRSARSQGIQPDGTTMPKIRAAMEYSDATGVAYGGDR
jgi:hypothetical protein